MTNENETIFLTAGGSGGHIFPAQAVGEELKKQGYNIVFITDFRGNNFSKKFLIGKEYRVFAGAYAGKPLLKKLFAMFMMFLGVIQSVLLMREHRPKAVIGFGGYASFPACFAASLLKIPLILHEQNAVLGGANRFLAKKATLIATTFPNVAKVPKNIKTAYVGVPVRHDILALAKQDYEQPTDNFNILIFGGSQGASLFSKVIPAALKTLPTDMQKKLNIVQQCRADDKENLEQSYANTELNVEISSFFTDIAERIKTAHLVICRAGASTIAELCVSGRPAFIVPIYVSPDAHQLANAFFLSENKAAVLCEEPKFSIDFLNNQIKSFILDSKELLQIANNAKSLGKPNAAFDFAKVIIETIKAK